MNERMRIGQMFPAQATPLGIRKQNQLPPGNSSFQELLNASSLKFSHHAEVRMKQRGISLQPEQLNKIVSAIEQAEAKGAKDSLVLFRDIAMIVNVPSRTVVTAMEGATMQGHVFTQIDSAVVIT